MIIYEVLNELNINYDEIEHPAVFTAEEAAKYYDDIDGMGVKNLFLINKKKQYYLAIVPDDKRADLKIIAHQLGGGNLSFASDRRLLEVLNLTPGSVTPLGLINDTGHQVTVLIDRNLVGEKILFHPLTNTKTVSIVYDDLIRFINHCGNNYQLVEL